MRKPARIGCRHPNSGCTCTFVRSWHNPFGVKATRLSCGKLRNCHGVPVKLRNGSRACWIAIDGRASPARGGQAGGSAAAARDGPSAAARACPRGGCGRSAHPGRGSGRVWEDDGGPRVGRPQRERARVGDARRGGQRARPAVELRGHGCGPYPQRPRPTGDQPAARVRNDGGRRGRRGHERDRGVRPAESTLVLDDLQTVRDSECLASLATPSSDCRPRPASS